MLKYKKNQGFTPYETTQRSLIDKDEKISSRGISRTSSRYRRSPQGDLSRTGFTLIELITVMAIVGILASAGAWFMVYTIKNAIVIPNQLNMDKLATEALEIMIEGDSQTKGLRFCRVVTTASANRVDFINQDSVPIYYRLDTSANKLYRSISGAAEQLIPSYAGASGISLTSKSGSLFTYYDANGAPTPTPANVRRVKMVLIAKTGTGAYANWEGQSEQESSIALKRLQ